VSYFPPSHICEERKIKRRKTRIKRGRRRKKRRKEEGRRRR